MYSSRPRPKKRGGALHSAGGALNSTGGAHNLLKKEIKKPKGAKEYSAYKPPRKHILIPGVPVL